MQTAQRQAGDITILDLKGRIMFGDGEEDLRDVITSVLESGRVNLILNLAEVPFIDSSGLSQLVRTFVTTSKRGGQMRLIGLTSRVREVLTMTRLLTVFQAFDSEEEAVASFEERRADA